MVNNPFWSRTLDEFVADFSLDHGAGRTIGDERRDLLRRRGGGWRRLAARAGEKGAVEKIASERVFLARFARAIEAFEPPIGLFNNLKLAEGDGDALDVKKGGIFPIVHGVRSLAIEHGLEETNTFERLDRLAEWTC